LERTSDKMKENFVMAGQLFTANIQKEGKNYVATCVEVAVSNYGPTKQKSIENLKETTKEHILAFPIDNKYKKE